MCIVACGYKRTLKQLEREQTHTHTDRHTHKTTTVTLAHARRGLKTDIQAIEGMFSCNYHDISTVSVGIYYPSKVSVYAIIVSKALLRF